MISGAKTFGEANMGIRASRRERGREKRHPAQVLDVPPKTALRVEAMKENKLDKFHMWTGDELLTWLNSLDLDKIAKSFPNYAEEFAEIQVHLINLGNAYRPKTGETLKLGISRLKRALSMIFRDSNYQGNTQIERQSRISDPKFNAALLVLNFLNKLHFSIPAKKSDWNDSTNI